MTKRTAADFAREAPADGEWTFELTDGTVLRPRPRSHYTYDETLAEAELAMEWARRTAALQSGEEDPGQPESPFHFELKVRFTKPNVYVEARKRAKETGEAVDADLSDYEALWAEVRTWPVESTRALIKDLDSYYPTPSSDEEDDDAAADPAGDAAGKSLSVVTS